MNLSAKEFADMKEQIKKQILDLDHQIYELETFYIEDTKETGNLLKGFDNYLGAKTARNQGLVKKQKVENYERLFSLSSIKSRTSEILEQSYQGEPLNRNDSNQIPVNKRNNRQRQGGMTKSGGKHLMAREDQNEEEESESGQGQNMEYSMDESEKNKGISKKKKITKSGIMRKA